MLMEKPCKFYKSGGFEECVAEEYYNNPCNVCKRAGGTEDKYIPRRRDRSRPVRFPCRFSIGADSPQCVAHEFYKFNPCDYCWFQDNRDNFYLPNQLLVCFLCGKGKDVGEVICTKCQFKVINILGYDAFNTGKKKIK